MREKDLHKIIREESSNDNTKLYNAIAEKHPELTQKAAKPEHKPRNNLAVVLAAVFAPVSAAVLAAVILIPTLVLRNGSLNERPGTSGTGFPTEDSSFITQSGLQYDYTNMNYTVKKYNEVYGTDFLYFDTESLVEYRVTEFSHKNTDAFLGLRTILTDRTTGYDIEYTVCKAKAPLDFLVYGICVCTNTATVSDCSVKWAVAKGNSYGIFDYDGYSYYITLKSNPDETRLFELIEILLSQ